MASELQRLADALGSRLRRSVAIDDPRIRLLAHTAHTGEVDEVRVGSIMQRSVPDDLVSFINERGAPQATDLFTLPAYPAAGMSVDRIGMPVRYEGRLLGYLWLLGSEGPVLDAQVDAIRDAASQAALILHREYLIGEIGRAREGELVRDLVSADANLRAEAAGALIEENLIAAGPVTVLVATLGHETGEPLSEEHRLALHAAIDCARRRLPPRRGLALSRPDHSLLLAVWSTSRSSAVDQFASELAGDVHEAVARELGHEESSCWVGIGGIRQHLADSHCSYREARQSADIARITGALGSTASYSRLGVYALLAKLAPDELADGIHPGIRQLTESAPDLAETLRSYLDNSGDAQRTAAQLHIHRATLYYRLRGIEKLSALDLSRGDDRLVAHLSIKLIGLLGLA